MKWVDVAPAILALEIPGVGVIVREPHYSMCFVPGARIVNDTIIRDDRTNPPLVVGKSAAAIRAEQPLIVDPGATPYITSDVEDSEY